VPWAFGLAGTLRLWKIGLLSLLSFSALHVFEKSPDLIKQTISTEVKTEQNVNAISMLSFKSNLICHPEQNAKDLFF
jgi:hypothetical protein